jgi:hypothetical protein
VRSKRPRAADCDPSTAFNLCVFEREYSIETVRRSTSGLSKPSRTPAKPPVTPLAAGDRSLRVSRATGAPGSDAFEPPERGLRLTGGPLHTRAHCVTRDQALIGGVSKRRATVGFPVGEGRDSEARRS